MKKREIKFRAWDKKEKKMLEAQNVILLPKGDGGQQMSAGASYNYILMQYTGLKDKNGVEIYELHELNNKYRVIYLSPRFALQDISTGDIIEFNEQDEYTITKEYSPI